ncbi:MAG: Uroporphyrinogen synthase [Crocinitomicaceae bacterium]|jgi:uroporphyrinogen-III synthase|nr:Uroporphyrinogen synthase [Crocinitomicaceae bacterium]
MPVSSVFISKNPGEVQAIASFCTERGIDLHAEAFISFEATGISCKPTSDVYVFGSKNAFDFFLEQKPGTENKLFAVIGEATKKHIESKGYPVAFSGKEAGKPDLVAREFATWLDGRRASFFLSDISKKSLAAYLDPEQYEEFIIYKTELLSKKVDRHFDVYAFTSPSNAEAFLQQNNIPDGAIVVSWGESTTTALKKHHISPQHTLRDSSQEELIQVMNIEL